MSMYDNTVKHEDNIENRCLIGKNSIRGVNVVSLQSNRLDCRTHKLIEAAVAHLDNIKIFA